MITITKKEAMWLVNEGAKYKDIIHRTIGVGRIYYMTEDRFWMKKLQQFRDSKVVK